MAEKDYSDWKESPFVGKVRQGKYGQILAFSPTDIKKMLAFVKENESWVSVSINFKKGTNEPYAKIMPPVQKDDTSYKERVRAGVENIEDDDLGF